MTKRSISKLDSDGTAAADHRSETPEPVEDRAGPASEPVESVISLATFLDVARVRRVEADLLKSITWAEKHTLTEWRQRLAEILAQPVGGNQ